ncbi:MAG TPA: oxygen-independent coproporphyrinogen III oxidase [Vicinamibacteria bacterium]|nr:oxygen-independent coproporphyrinogen III oxidase [Vicinamibacteria bacterium]
MTMGKTSPDERGRISGSDPMGVPVTADLLREYDRPGPRYTSYPTAVEFAGSFDEAAYRRQLDAAAEKAEEPLSLYLHLPFCEERCSFCGCMVIITRRREVAAHYLGYLKREIEMLAARLKGRRRVVQYHWGGGTPTYLSVPQMTALHEAVTRHFDVQPGAEVAIEVDPRVTSREQIERLRELGFNRLSLGVQDFTPEVQQAINRIQSELETRALFEVARSLGYASINVDLIYGLPFQTRASFGRSVEAVVALRPDRVAVYSYAHVPWIRGNQKRIRPEDLPSRELKIELFLEAMERFLAAGYRQIGMDHFALAEDELARAAEQRRLHRNFMGYTTRPAADMVGLGVSAIGRVGAAFAQNTKKLSVYYAALEAGRFPIERGYLLDADDELRAHVITELMCNFHLERARVEARFGIDFDRYFAPELAELRAGPVAHGFLEVGGEGLLVTPKGRLFVRNLCMVFDRYLRARTLDKPVFSRTI